MKKIHNGVRGGSRLVIFGMLFCAALLATSCTDRDPATLTNPTALTQGFNVGFSAASTTVIAQPVNNFFCPSTFPFTVPMVVVVQPNGTTGLVLTQVRVQFTDTANRQMPQVTLPGPVPTTQFGSALTASRDAFSIPLSLGIGCGFGNTGTVVVLVDTLDGHGRMSTGRVSINVR
jgi:hypothetical protein